jgi:hypothetical protein
MTYGSRIILSAGAYTTDYAFTFEFAGNALPGTGMFIMEGASKDTTSYKMGSGSTQEYVIYTGRVNDQAYLFKNMKIYAEQPTNDTALATIVYCGAAARTGVTCYFRDTILGDPAIDTNGFILNVYNAIDVKRSYMYGSAGNSVVRPEKDAASISIQYSVLNGGAMHLYLNGFAGLTTTLYNNVLYGYTLYGVRYDQDMPTLKNNIFYGGTGNLTSINDQGSATETDTQIDYNIFYSNGDVPWEVANAGGSHSVTKDPSFISAGSDFRRNPPLNDGVSVAGVHIAGCSDFSGQPCLKGAAPDIGAYEKSLGGLFQQFNKTNRYAPHRRLH